jgi:NAD(P)H-flavin reductase
MASREVIETTLTQIIQETPRVRTFRLSVPKGHPFTFKAGQFVMASVPDFLNTKGRPVRRAYSIASSPLDLEKGYLELTITRVGDGGFFSNRIHDCREGDRVLIDGPYGAFLLREKSGPQPSRFLFVGSGSGIAPLRGMIRTLLMEDRKVPIDLYYGFRHKNDFIYERELSEYADTLPDFRLVTSLSGKDHPELPPVWKGRFGRITTLLPELVRGFSDEEIYMCGPPEMVRQTDAFFQSAGYPEGRIHKEQW